MNSDEFPPASRLAASRSSRNVALSPWVNERFPAWEELLSAHDVARLTRRPRWILASLIMLGRFPRKRRYHGRGIGWLRSDVLHWLSKDLDVCSCRTELASVGRPRVMRQASLPLECASPCAAHRSRGECSTGSSRRR